MDYSRSFTESTAASSQQEFLAAQGRRVLLVDDAPAPTALMARLFQLLGHETRTAGDGRSAIKEASSLQPNLILLDLRLPDMHGCDVARAIRALPGMSHTLLVALTGSSDEESQEAASQAGFDEYLVKPVDGATLERLFSHPKLLLASDSLLS